MPKWLHGARVHSVLLEGEDAAQPRKLTLTGPAIRIGDPVLVDDHQGVITGIEASTVMVRVDERARHAEKPLDPRCPDCQAPMVSRTGPHGRFWGCSRYKGGCRGTRDSMGRSPRERNEGRTENPAPQRRNRWID